MDAERVILLSGLGFVFVVAAFVLFGPMARPKRRQGQICGLANLGNTCFLNALLQALASCPAVVEWLRHYSTSDHSFIVAMHTAILVVNGQHPDLFEDPYVPSDVIKCLCSKGWTIAPGEHDVHELLNVIMTTIEEEIQHTSFTKICTLADVLDVEIKEKENGFLPMKFPAMSVSHQTTTTVLNTGSETGISGDDDNSICQISDGSDVHSEASDSLVPSATVKNVNNSEDVNHENSNLIDCTDSLLPKSDNCGQDFMQPPDNLRQTKSDICELNKGSNHVYSERGIGSNCKRRVIQGRAATGYSTGIVRAVSCCEVSSSSLSNQCMWNMPPYEGLLAGQTQCTRCRYKSPVKYDKFGCISLPLPSDRGFYPSKITLHQLLEKFVSPELINDVVCDNCAKKNKSPESTSSSVFKTYNFGKLPVSLIFHIQRTMWESNGMSKRHDYIEFPETLSMHEYTYSQMQKRMNNFSSETECDFLSKQLPFVIDRFKHLYRLSAVIVHKGSVEYGHFVTYRRSPARPNSWYYTSDSEVEESSLNEVLQTPAYLLFYVKCQMN